MRLASADPSSWHLIGVDTNGADGFSCEWPEYTNRPPADKKICLVAVASDFFQDSAVIVSIAASGGHGLALDRAGYVWCFGGNTHGQLGRQLTGPAPRHFEYRPLKVLGVNNVVAIGAGNLHSLAVSRDGTGLGDE